MGFNGCSFSFNGIHSSQFGLTIYDVDNNGQDDMPITSVLDIAEDRLPQDYSSLYYGGTQNTPLKLSLTFGIDPPLLDENYRFERYDIEAISAWLTAVDGYRWFVIDQPDMAAVRYKCIVTELTPISVGWSPFAFSCKMQCDSPFAYRFPETYRFASSGESTFVINNKSSFNGRYYPHITITPLQAGQSLGSISITNLTDGNRKMEFFANHGTTSFPSDVQRIEIDNKRGIITNDAGLNIYNFFNFGFLGLKRGANRIKTTGNFNLEIKCEFPVNYGG